MEPSSPLPAPSALSASSAAAAEFAARDHQGGRSRRVGGEVGHHGEARHGPRGVEVGTEQLDVGGVRPSSRDPWGQRDRLGQVLGGRLFNAGRGPHARIYIDASTRIFTIRSARDERHGAVLEVEAERWGNWAPHLAREGVEQDVAGLREISARDERAEGPR